MFRIVRALCLISVLLFSCTAAFADIVKGSSSSGSYAWQTWSPNTGTPYWTGNSWDNPSVDVGDCLTGQCTMASVPGAIPYWGDSNGAADPDFYFENTNPGGKQSGTLEIELAGNADFNEFGWYDRSEPEMLYVIFAGSATTTNNATASFTPTANYGFWFTGAAGTWYTESRLNTDGKTSDQHFAVFQQDGASTTLTSYWLGMEDLPLSSSDKDYQDMIVKITPTNVPEPGSILLLIVMLGVVGMGWRARRLVA